LFFKYYCTKDNVSDPDPNSIGSADPAARKSKRWPPKKEKTKKFSRFEGLDVLPERLAAVLELVNNSEKKLIKHFF
jgi:hypothetical protein